MVSAICAIGVVWHFPNLGGGWPDVLVHCLLRRFFLLWATGVHWTFWDPALSCGSNNHPSHAAPAPPPTSEWASKHLPLGGRPVIGSALICVSVLLVCVPILLISSRSPVLPFNLYLFVPVFVDPCSIFFIGMNSRRCWPTGLSPHPIRSRLGVLAHSGAIF